MWRRSNKTQELVNELRDQNEKQELELQDMLNKIKERKLMVKPLLICHLYWSTSFWILLKTMWHKQLERQYKEEDVGELATYDLVLKTTTFEKLSTQGWKLKIKDENTAAWFSSSVLKMREEDRRKERKATTWKAGQVQATDLAEGNYAIVAIMGFYDRGKTWVLNKLMDKSFPSSKKIATEGLSFSLTTSPSQTKWLILDTAGFGSPVSCKFPAFPVC